MKAIEVKRTGLAQLARKFSVSSVKSEKIALAMFAISAAVSFLAAGIGAEAVMYTAGAVALGLAHLLCKKGGAA